MTARAPTEAPTSLLLLAFCGCLLAAILPSTIGGTIFPNDCPNACNPVQNSPTEYKTCQNKCQACLLNSYDCRYKEFQPNFSGSGNSQTVSSYSCWCYWPWWAWLLLAIGIAAAIGSVCTCCILCALCLVRKMRNRKHADQGPHGPLGHAGKGNDVPVTYPPTTGANTATNTGTAAV